MITVATSRTRTAVATVAGVLSVLAASGCETGPPESGFLTDYSRLQRVGEDAPFWAYVDPEDRRNEMNVKVWLDRTNWDDLGNYDKLKVDPVVVELHEGAEGTYVPKHRLDELTQFMHNTIVEKYGEHYAIVNELGPGILHVRTAITDLYPAYRYQTPDPDGHPVKNWANSRPGGVTFEAEAVDGDTGAVIVAYVFEAKGTQLGTLNTDKPWDQAKDGIRRTVEFTLRRMDEAHRIQAAQQSD
jgi:hypothetical protein